MKRFVPGIIFTLIIVLLGFGVGWLVQRELLPNPLVTATYQVDIAGLAPRVGILAGVLVFVVFLVSWVFQRDFERKQAQAQDFGWIAGTSRTSTSSGPLPVMEKKTRDESCEGRMSDHWLPSQCLRSDSPKTYTSRAPVPQRRGGNRGVLGPLSRVIDSAQALPFEEPREGSSVAPQ